MRCAMGGGKVKRGGREGCVEGKWRNEGRDGTRWDFGFFRPNFAHFGRLGDLIWRTEWDLPCLGNSRLGKLSTDLL